MAAFTITAHTKIGNLDFTPRFIITGTVDPEVYATGGVDILADLNTAFQAAVGRTDIGVTTIHDLQIGGSDDPAYFGVSNGGDLQVFVRDEGTASAAPTIAWSGAITANPAHTFTLPAGSYAIAAEGTAGLTAPLFLQETAAGATQEAAYDPAARTIVTLAGDACTEIKALLFTPGAVSVIPSVAEVPNLTDLTGLVAFSFSAICS